MTATVDELIDIAGYLQEQLKLLKEVNKMVKKCLFCDKPLGRIRYHINGLPGLYCRECAHKFYRLLDYPFYLVDSGGQKGLFDDKLSDDD